MVVSPLDDNEPEALLPLCIWESRDQRGRPIKGALGVD